MILIGGDGGRSGVPRHLEHLLRACEGDARFIVLSEQDRGGFAAAPRARVRHIPLPGLASHLRPWRMLRTARLLARLLRREAPDLVWAHARMGVLLLHLVILAQAVLGTGRDRGRPALAFTYHGLPFGPGQARWLGALAVWVERLSLRLGPPRCLIFLSSSARDTFVARIGPDLCARHRTAFLRNSSSLGRVSDPAQAERARSSRRILVVGRVARQKNLPRALRIFGALPGSYRMTFCGEGTDSHAFRRQARRIIGDGALRRVEFIGPVEDLRPWLATADAFLLTSRYEGQPIAALEAFEAGVPLALADLPGCREVLAHHPHAAVLSGGAGREDVTEDALRLIALAEAHARARGRQRQDIRAAWTRHHGFAAWSRDMQALLASLLPAPSDRDTTEQAAPVSKQPLSPPPLTGLPPPEGTVPVDTGAVVPFRRPQGKDQGAGSVSGR